MSKNELNRLKKSRLIPNTYKEQYLKDYEELKGHLTESEKRLNDEFSSLSKKEIRNLDAFLSGS